MVTSWRGGRHDLPFQVDCITKGGGVENQRGLFFVGRGKGPALPLLSVGIFHPCHPPLGTFLDTKDSSVNERSAIFLHPQKHKPFLFPPSTRFFLWLYKKKFGEEEGAQMKQCFEETSSKGPSLLHMAGLDPKKLKADLKNKDAKKQIQVVKATYLKLNASSVSQWLGVC